MLMTHSADRTQIWLRLKLSSEKAPPLAAAVFLGMHSQFWTLQWVLASLPHPEIPPSRRRWHCTHMKGLSQSVEQPLCLQGMQSTCRISWRSQHCSSQPCNREAARQQQ